MDVQLKVHCIAEQRLRWGPQHDPSRRHEQDQSHEKLEESVDMKTTLLQTSSETTNSLQILSQAVCSAGVQCFWSIAVQQAVVQKHTSFSIVIAMRWPRTQASQSCIFSARVGFSCWRVGWFSESIPSFEARSWQGVAMRHKEEQRRAAASLLILLIVPQALLLLLFKALYSTSACLAIKLKFSSERKGNNLFRLSFWLSSACRRVRLSQFLLFLVFSSHFLFVKCF